MEGPSTETRQSDKSQVKKFQDIRDLSIIKQTFISDLSLAKFGRNLSYSFHIFKVKRRTSFLSSLKSLALNST